MEWNLVETLNKIILEELIKKESKTIAILLESYPVRLVTFGKNFSGYTD